MAKLFSVVPENSSGLLRDECHALIALVAGERADFDTRELWLARAAERSGLTPRAIKALYYGEVTDPDSPSVLALRNAAERYEIEDIAARFEQLARRVRRLIHARR